MDIKIYDAELKLMEIVWELGPINSTELVKVCLERLNWKKSTTYTNIRRLSERGILENKDTMVNALVTKDQAGVDISKDHLNKFYEGSLKLLFANFLDKKQISKDELKEIQKMIEDSTE